PVAALWRRLHATAETFAAVGLLLVILDGYAAWAVNLAHVRDLPGTRYAALVCAVTAAVGLGYRAATRLTGPAFVAVLAAPPVLPLFVARAQPDAAGSAVVFAGVAVLSLAVVLRHRGRTDAPATALRVTGWILYGLALAPAAIQALVAEAQAG